MSNLRTIQQLAAEFAREGLNYQSVHDILTRTKLKPEAEMPFGKGVARFFDKNKAYEVLRAALAKRKEREAEKAAKATKAKQVEAAGKAAADDHTVAGATSDIKYLIGLIEEQQAVITQLVAGNQLLFKHVEGIAHQVNALVTEWRGENKPSPAPSNGVDIDAVHRRAS